MFLQGYITPDLEPLIQDISIQGKKNKISLHAILDTGFNGELALPQKLKSKSILIPFGVKSFELANGHIVQQEIFLATLVVNNKKIPVEATLTQSSTALIGMEFIRNHIAIFDLKKNFLLVK